MWCRPLVSSDTSWFNVPICVEECTQRADSLAVMLTDLERLLPRMLYYQVTQASRASKNKNKNRSPQLRPQSDQLISSYQSGLIQTFSEDLPIQNNE